VTTCLSLVVFSTIFFGSTVGVLAHCFFKNKEEKVEQALDINVTVNSSVTESLSESD